MAAATSPATAYGTHQAMVRPSRLAATREPSRTSNGWASGRPILSTNTVSRIRPNARVPARVSACQVASGRVRAHTIMLSAPPSPPTPIRSASGPANAMTRTAMTTEEIIVGRKAARMVGGMSPRRSCAS